VAGQRRRGEQGGQDGLREDDFVNELVPDPSGSPDVVALGGFVGKSRDRGYWRLYRTLDLDDYVEIAETDIVRSERAGPDGSSLAGTTVWVKKGANLVRKRVTSEQVRAELLRGGSAAGAVGAQQLIGGGVQARPGRRIVVISNLICDSDLCFPTMGCPASDWCPKPDTFYCVPSSSVSCMVPC
jgi:hypothetical protein